MRFDLSSLAVTASMLATATAISVNEIPTDLPVSTLLTSAQTHLTKGETSEALVYYDAAIARDPTNYLSFFKRATTYLSLGRASQATEDFNKVLSLKPGFQGAHVQLAKIRSKHGDWESARKEYTSAGKDASSPEIEELNLAEQAILSAEAAKAKGEWEDCINYAGTAILVASRAPALRELRSHCRFERGEVEEGMGDLRHLLQMRPGDIAPHVLISATTFYGLGDLEAGLAQVRKCLHSDPDSKLCKKLHRQQKVVSKTFSKVTGQLAKKQPTTAGKALVGSEEEPGLIQTIQEQVDELRRDGHIPSRAKVKLQEQVVEMACQAFTVSSSKDATKYCSQALEMNPESFWGLLHRAKTLLTQEEYEAAIQTLENAAQLHQDKRDKIEPVLNKARIALKRSKTKDYYKVLGVANDADERQIKHAYRQASKKYHPDKAAKQGINKEDAEKKMASINEAYEVLSNPELRARFDRGDDPNSQQQQQGNPFQGSPFGGGHPFVFQQSGPRFKFDFGQGGGGPFGF
ncbi:DnaJ -like protein subfamily C member 3 [Escovopsis weberi]|uniref:Tetratricopeptide repeat and J domain-containing co-chaperone DNJ1 n=1 Tax=Escovopsis weberi TaxID=150374 RepID=A0A0M8MS89_ESCWE|nr:DnaJ -like protein subfamily C member 3 [Escovopsis weberi]